MGSVWRDCGHPVSYGETECLHCRISELERLSVEKTKFADRIITERDALQARLDAAEVRLAEMVFVYTPEDVTAEEIELLNEQQAIAGEDDE